MDNPALAPAEPSSHQKDHAADNNVLDPANQPKKKKKKKHKSLKEKKQPIISELDLRAKYPHTVASMDEMELFEDRLTEDQKKMMVEYLMFVSEKELDDMENQWKENHFEEIERSRRRISTYDKQSALVQKAVEAYRSRKN